jgi:hypothetical protein
VLINVLNRPTRAWNVLSIKYPAVKYVTGCTPVPGMKLLNATPSATITLPSLTASESIVSDRSIFGFKHHVEAQATFRALQSPAAARLDESRQINLLNGKLVPPGQHPRLPFTLFGGFGRFQDMFFSAKRRACFTFTLIPKTTPASPLELQINPNPSMATMPECEAGLQGLTGIARVDPAYHQLTHLERTIPVVVAAEGNHASFASVDCAPTQVGDQTFWLPTVVIGRMDSGKAKGQFTAHYTNYRRFTSTAILLPAAPE